MEGWISLDRKIQEHWVWKNVKYFRAWTHCLFRANFKDTKVLINGEFQLVKRGEFITSIHKFAGETGMSIQEVRTFWKLLEKDKMIVKKSTKKATKGATKLTICNYEDYQDKQQRKQQTSNKAATIENKVNKETSKEKVPKRKFEVHDRILTIFDEWLEYKKARKETYKTEKSTELALKKLVNLSGNSPRQARLIVEDSMASNYAGFFGLKSNGSPNKSSRSNSHRSGDLDYSKKTKIL